MRRVHLGTGVELAVREFGEGDPVLLLHAWGETHRVFDRLVPLLAASAHLIVPDQRGTGDSAKPLEGYSLQNAADDVIALMDALHVDACWLVGTSSGGYLAQQVAVDHPHRVRGLALVGSPIDLRGPLPSSFAALLASFDDPVTPADIEAVNRALTLHNPVPSAFLKDQATAALTIPRHVWQVTLDGLLTAVPPLQRGRITAPTLILWGADDDVLPGVQGRQLASAIPNSRLVTYEATGHLVLWERPERVAADVTAFLTSNA